MGLERGALLADDALTGAAWCHAHSRLVDGWLASLLQTATGGQVSGIALVAIGGYGRSELCPQSDIDVMLVHDRRSDIASVADAVWYPIWDEALHLGHSVATPKEALALASDDLDSATALLRIRLVAGDPDLADRLANGALDQWRKRGTRWLEQLGARVEERHASAPEVAFCLEPDLKDGRGGLRDVHSIRWAEKAGVELSQEDSKTLDDCYAALLDARVELQRATQRPTNLLTMQEQTVVARALGLGGPDELMAGIAQAARSIAWTSDELWRRQRPASRKGFRLFSRPRRIAPGVVLDAGEVRAEDDAPVEDPVFCLLLAKAAATNVAPIQRSSLERLAGAVVPPSDPWPQEAREGLVDLLLTGRAAIGVIEALDQRGIWTRLLPEWTPVRTKPQRNAYHRFTVDRHLLEAAANAASLTRGVSRPDLLVVGALFHDLGKGLPGDHTEVGIKLVGTIGARLGFPPTDVAVLTDMVRHHLLLADVATRRDIDDPATVQRVADEVGTVELLQLLAALTEADSLATGPAAWTGWKADLLTQLVERVVDLIEGNVTTASEAGFPTSSQLERLALPGEVIEGNGAVLTVMTDDRPGLFSRVAGVLAIDGLDVLSAAAYSSDDGRALAEFRVHDPFRDAIPWPKVVRNLELALAGRFAVEARVAERAQRYASKRVVSHPTPTTVSFDNSASPTATVIDVHSADDIGVLYRITRALAELDLDIRSARVQTLGPQVVDAFYVRDRARGKVEDPDTLGEIERAIVHSLGSVR